MPIMFSKLIWNPSCSFHVMQLTGPLYVITTISMVARVALIENPFMDVLLT